MIKKFSNCSNLFIFIYALNDIINNLQVLKVKLIIWILIRARTKLIYYHYKGEKKEKIKEFLKDL